jgi:hypothetical protein
MYNKALQVEHSVVMQFIFMDIRSITTIISQTSVRELLRFRAFLNFLTASNNCNGNDNLARQSIPFYGSNQESPIRTLTSTRIPKHI